MGSDPLCSNPLFEGRLPGIGSKWDRIHFAPIHFLRSVYTGSDPELLAFTRDRIQMGSDPLCSNPLLEGHLHGIGSRTVGVYKGSDPNGIGFILLQSTF